MLQLAPTKTKPVTDYFEGQGRFRHLFKPENKQLLDQLQQVTDEQWKKLLEKCVT
jgi:pyruvate ferredoxin oxidoreductase beta subunit